MSSSASLWSPLRWWKLTWPAIVAQRVLLLVRFVGWAVSSVVSLVVALVTEVVYPLLAWLWAQATAFGVFYFSLLWGEVSLEIILFAPMLLVAFSWLWWLFWPTFSCWLELAWPVFRLLLDFTVTFFGVVMSLFNFGVRLFNTFLPVLGSILYGAATLLVEYYRYVTLLIGELNANVVIDGLSEIMVYVAELSINIAEAMISTAPTVLETFSSVMGVTMSIFMETAPVLVNVTIILVRILPNTIGPILGETARVVGFVMRTFFRRRSDTGLAGAGPADPYRSREQLGLWRATGELRSEYWTPESATRAERYIENTNRWLADNPTGSHNTYYMYHNSIPQRRPADVLADMQNRGRRADPRPGDHNATAAAARARRAERIFASHFGPTGEDQLFAFEPAHAEAMRHAHVAAAPSQADLDATTPCRSRFCAGADVPHPLHTIARTHRTDRTRLSREVAAADGAERSARHRHVAASLHATRMGLHAGIRSLKRGGARIRQHLGATWRGLTGHADVGTAAEAALGKHPDPLDSLISHTPVIADIWPFSVMAAHAPEHERDAYWGTWIRKRAQFYADVYDESSGTTRRMMHVSVREMNLTEAVRVFNIRTESRQHARRQAGLGQGAMSVKYGEPVYQDLENGGVADGGQLVGADADLFDNPAFFIGGAAGGNPASIALIGGRLLEPALPTLKLLYTRDCFSVPKHPWCLPEIPRQIYCLFISYVRLIPRNLPVRLCKYEEECGSIGFCVHPRPDITTVINPFNMRPYLISWCWLQNVAVYFVTMLGLIFPIVRLNLQILEVTVPFLGPWIFGPLWRIIPEPISMQDSVCLVVYMYAPVAFFVSLYYWRSLYALFNWGLATVRRLIDLLSAARATALERNEALAQQPWYQELLQRRTAAAATSRLTRDRAFAYLASLGRPPLTPARAFAPTPDVGIRPPGAGPAFYPQRPGGVDPESLTSQDALDEAAREATYSSVPMPSQLPLEARIGAERQPAPHELEELRNALAAEAELFGHPPADADHLGTALDHATRWHPLIHSAHYSSSWLNAHYLPLHPSLRPGVGALRSPLRYARSIADVPE